METKFHMGDSVYSPHFGEGIVTGIDDNSLFLYPIHVEWQKKGAKGQPRGDIFTPEGNYTVGVSNPDYDIVHKEEGDEEKMGQIAGVINHNISKKEYEKMVAEGAKFHVGDMVYSNFSGVGKIIKIGVNKNLEYPIEVKWCDKKDCATFDYDFFTLGGNFFSDHRNANKDIVPIEEVDMEFEEKDDVTIERMEDALNKKVEDAVNPAHYKVKGLPEAIDIMNHLMTPEQFEGFLWGNIMKYVYRFGRKGDKGETAGKIAWYANQLKAVEDWRKEHNET